MDLSNIGTTYDPDTGATLELRDLTDAALLNDDGSPMTITVLGADSEVAVRARNAQQNRRLQAGPRAKLTAEGFDADGAAFLARLTTGWNITLGGEKPPFTYEAAVKLYSDRRLAFIREQVDAFIADRANFSKASATT